MRLFSIALLLTGFLACGAAAQNLHISDATYAAKDGRHCDPVRAVRSACQGKPSCEIDVDNRMCGDPAKATYKELVVGYKCGGGRLEMRVPEGKWMKLSCGSSSAARSGGGTPLHISDATYAAKDGRHCDPRKKLRSMCEGEPRCSIDANNRLCGDPAKATYKELVIGYKCGGGRQEVRVPEGRSINLACK
jgi:hypothetical protein